VIGTVEEPVAVRQILARPAPPAEPVDPDPPAGAPTMAN